MCQSISKKMFSASCTPFYVKDTLLRQKQKTNKQQQKKNTQCTFESAKQFGTSLKSSCINSCKVHTQLVSLNHPVPQTHTEKQSR